MQPNRAWPPKQSSGTGLTVILTLFAYACMLGILYAGVQFIKWAWNS